MGKRDAREPGEKGVPVGVLRPVEGAARGDRKEPRARKGGDAATHPISRAAWGRESRGGGDAGQTRRGDGGWSKREPKEQLARHVGPNPASARPRPAHETPNSKTSVRRTRNSLAGKKWYSWFHLLVHSSSSEIRQAVAALLSPACARLSRQTSFESASFDDPHLDPT